MNVPVSILGDYLQIFFFFFNLVEKNSLIVEKFVSKLASAVYETC